MIIPVVMAVVLAQAGAAPTAAQSPIRPASGAPATPSALEVQVMLDRAGFSPGVIDGKPGKNTEKALAAYTRSGRGTDGPIPSAVTDYTITHEDVEGPYEPDLPADLMQQAKLTALSYRTPLEALAERFHCTPALLKRLNPRSRLAAGDAISVPNVDRLVMPVPRPKSDPEKVAAAMRPATTAARRGGSSGRGAAPAKRTTSPANRPAAATDQTTERIVKPDVTISVNKSLSAVTVTDESGTVVFYAPVTTGSDHDPLPIGEWKVKGVQFNPIFRYNPALFWDADSTHTRAVIPSGPNNPVGLVWIDLSKEHYGIHGTPEPSAVGRSESHGCVRLTNWDAVRLAGLVKPGTRVIFAE